MFIFCRQQYTPTGFSVPLMPFLPSVSIILNTFLLGTIDPSAWIGFAYFTVAIIGVYVFYSVHAASYAEERCDDTLACMHAC